MITYDRLWETMKSKGYSQYKLIKEHNFSRSQIFRLKHNYNVSTHTLNVLCNILDCSIEEVAEFTKDENPFY